MQRARAAASGLTAVEAGVGADEAGERQGRASGRGRAFVRAEFIEALNARGRRLSASKPQPGRHRRHAGVLRRCG